MLKSIFNPATIQNTFFKLYIYRTKSYMKKLYILFTFLSFSFFASAQSFTPQEGVKHVGEKIKVCGKIFGGRFFETSNGSPTLLNIGAAFPASPLTIMIPLEVRTKLGYIPEQELKDKNICVTGTVILFKDKPEIVINEISQIEIVL